MERFKTRIEMIDGKAWMWVGFPVQALLSHLTLGQDNDDVIAATVKLLEGKPEGMSPSDLLQQLDETGFSYHPDLDWKERRKQYTSHLWRASGAGGRLVHLKRGCYALRRPQVVFSDDDGWKEEFERLAVGGYFKKTLGHGVAAAMMVMSGWWLKPVHLDNLLGVHNHLFG